MQYENILVIGAPRSGTTLLSGIITGNDDCLPNLPECTILTQIIEHYFNLINYCEEERFRVYIQDKEALLDIYRKHLNNMINNLTQQFKNDSYKYLVLKDPILTKYVDIIPRFFGSDSKIIYIIRDPRAVISSMLKVEQSKNKNKNKYFNNTQEKELIKKVIDYIFNYYYILHTSDIYQNQKLMIVKYEDLISTKEHILLDLEKFLGYKIIYKPFERNCFNFSKNDPTFSDNYGKDIVNISSDFKDVLSSKTINSIKFIFSGYNTQYRWWE